ncbi:hypothetical protein V5F59_21710 [Xanthobacter autotrophicus DSM 431]|uniref:GCG_CRPN prefix-to-repeats domain-containing protein n=1 Tax=Xanthobacter nonsaccharivorans TaxID=3119912 RepID=UPI00372A7D1D
MRKLLILGVAAAAFGLADMGTASAGLPLPTTGRQVASDVAPVEQVRQGCGIGWRRNAWGGCRRQWAPAGPWGANACWYRPGPFGPVRVCR